MVPEFDDYSLYVPDEIPNFQRHPNLPGTVTTLVFSKEIISQLPYFSFTNHHINIHYKPI